MAVLRTAMAKKAVMAAWGAYATTIILSVLLITNCLNASKIEVGLFDIIYFMIFLIYELSKVTSKN